MALDKCESEKDGAGGGRAMERREHEDASSCSFTQTPIYDAIRRRRSRSRLLHALQRHPEHVQLREPGTRYTYLHLAVAVSDEESEVAMAPIVYQLSNAGVEVDAKDCKNRTALELAIVKGLRVMMVALLRIGTDQTIKDYRAVIDSLRIRGREALMEEFDRYSPDIWEAATTGDLGSVFVLVNSWCRVKVKRQGRTLLETLRRRGSGAEMVSLLASYEMTIEFVHATLAGDESTMLDILMDECHCDVDILDISYVDPQLGSLRPRSLRDTAIALNHPGRILQLLSPKCNRYDPSTGIPDTDLILYNTASSESDATKNSVPDAADKCFSSREIESSHHSRPQTRTSASADQNPLLTLSGIEPWISGEQESDDDDIDTNDLHNCTYRSFKNDDDEDPSLFKVTGKVRVSGGVKDVRVNRKAKDDAKLGISNDGEKQNRSTRFKVIDGVKVNGKARDNARTCNDDYIAKDSQRVLYNYERVDNEKRKGVKVAKRGASEDTHSHTAETSTGRDDQYTKLSEANETLERHHGTYRTQRKNGRSRNKSSLCIVS